MSEINTAYLLLGSNIEPQLEFINKAVSMLHQEKVSVVKKSSIYESEAWGFKSDNHFLNQLLVVETRFSARELLAHVLQIEKEMGRVRKSDGGYVSRNIDIDILYFNNSIIDEPDLVIPHPRLHRRRFALEPLVEIVPDFEHPILSKTNKELLENLDDQSKVVVFKANNAE